MVGDTCASGRLSHPPSNTPAVNTNAADLRNEYLASEGLLRDCAIEFEFTFEFHDLRALVNPVVDGDYSARLIPLTQYSGNSVFGSHSFSAAPRNDSQRICQWSSPEALPLGRLVRMLCSPPGEGRIKPAYSLKNLIKD